MAEPKKVVISIANLDEVLAAIASVRDAVDAAVERMERISGTANKRGKQ